MISSYCLAVLILRIDFVLTSLVALYGAVLIVWDLIWPTDAPDYEDPAP